MQGVRIPQAEAADVAATVVSAGGAGGSFLCSRSPSFWLKKIKLTMKMAINKMRAEQ